jgi:hypothetical protein
LKLNTQRLGRDLRLFEGDNGTLSVWRPKDSDTGDFWESFLEQLQPFPA